MSDKLFQHKMRLKFNMYSSRTAYNRLEKAIEENNNHEIYASTGELLLWVLTTDEWHKKNGDSNYESKRDNSDGGKIMSGLRHAYNMVKHNMDLFEINQKEGGRKFPFSFPMTFPEIKVFWIPGKTLDGLHKNQKENYIEHIEGKEVLKTFSQALTFLNQESQKYIFKD
ncbi:hypothetical protein [Paraliobacillus sediminis]|uniref:hypothetical protein n=1 Tax=Paraliobacillus sediminis TaxID=1885916 RepID=UPI000E3D017A|nr:hypothetical protein [Paraliobacillus sediminis]